MAIENLRKKNLPKLERKTRVKKSGGMTKWIKPSQSRKR